jgi:hypothetical protein
MRQTKIRKKERYIPQTVHRNRTAIVDRFSAMSGNTLRVGGGSKTI